jgi:hypothetical protein
LEDVRPLQVSRPVRRARVILHREEETYSDFARGLRSWRFAITSQWAQLDRSAPGYV